MRYDYNARLQVVEIMLWNLEQIGTDGQLDFVTYRRFKLRLLGVLA